MLSSCFACKKITNKRMIFIMQTIRNFGIGALLYGAALFMMGNASAFPLNIGNSSIRGAGDDAAHALVIQAQCGPGGCPPSGARQPGGRPVPVPGDDRRRRGSSDLYDLGIGIGTGIFVDEMTRSQNYEGQRYVEDWRGFRCKPGLVPTRSKTGKVTCVRPKKRR